MSRILNHISSSTWTGPSQAKYASLTTMAHQKKIRVDELRAMGNGVTLPFWSSGKSVQLEIVRQADGSATSVLRWAVSPGGTLIVASAGFDMATLPANGNDVILYADYIGGGDAHFAIASADGSTVYLSSTVGSALAALGTTTGEFYCRTGSWDSWAIMNARRSGATRFAKPHTTDADMVGLYWFAEGTGRYSAEAKGGTDFDLTFASPNPAVWETGGTWNADSPVSQPFRPHNYYFFNA